MVIRIENFKYLNCIYLVMNSYCQLLIFGLLFFKEMRYDNPLKYSILKQKGFLQVLKIFFLFFNQNGHYFTPYYSQSRQNRQKLQSLIAHFTLILYYWGFRQFQNQSLQNCYKKFFRLGSLDFLNVNAIFKQKKLNQFQY
ncbi:transmembrane protein, putative (macronuclear) [Tetrahymena thermophila SB210]|uniref:Transmembrane protein, putative n=1 Tax=Tetrahymena thermophila (strain SB210) TaxID=312017 RepID=W7X929_TETTS|nr:transmembrane protein, putative [Tetrahymena thermophila SB210]EWS73852.1 transmembrane protein, putative [Tetrahymena thermophila SB210]|eukprot:XP_012653599.1 transmembrane protein, putative [Tetrahymena thermophila SB210]